MSSRARAINNIKLSLVARHAHAAGGLEKQLQRIAHAFLDRGVAVTLLTKDPSTPFNLSQQIKHHFLPVKKCPRFQAINAFDKMCTTYHKNSSHLAIFGIDRIRYATHLRAGNGVHRAYLDKRALCSSPLTTLKTRLNLTHRSLLLLEKECFESPKLRLVFTNSEMVKREILTYYSLPTSRIQVIHNGVEWREWGSPFHEWQKRKLDLCRTFNLSPSLYHFLFIGHGYRRKGLSLLLNAFAKLPKGVAHLSVIGKEKHPFPFYKECRKLGISDRVTFFGAKKNTLDFYALGDCLVIPSLYDPFANVTVEALAMGLYVISSPFNGGSEVITKENGRVIDRLFDEEAFLHALKCALNRPKTALQALAIRKTVEHLDFSHQLNTLVNSTLASL